MVMFQLPSTAILVSPASRQPEWLLGKLFCGGIAHLAAKPNWRLGASSPDAAGHQDAECDILYRERRELGAEQHYRDVERPQLHVAAHRGGDGAAAEHEQQRSRSISRGG